jgi:Arc/MetJ family transcription regulator
MLFIYDSEYIRVKVYFDRGEANGGWRDAGRAIRTYRCDTPFSARMVYRNVMSRTNIEINEDLIRKARKLTRLKTKRQIVDRALELLLRSERRKGILRYYGTGIWKGDLKASRRDRA